MNWRHIALMLLSALLFLTASVLISSLNLWSFLGNYTMPWLCTVMAICICIVSITSLLSDAPLSSLPISCVTVIVIATSIILALGLFVDGISYAFPKDSIGSIGEWLGFTIILLILFWIPRQTKRGK